MTEKQKQARREYMRAWRAAHPEKMREYKAKYRAAHPDKVRAANARHWARVAQRKEEAAHEDQ